MKSFIYKLIAASAIFFVALIAVVGGTLYIVSKASFKLHPDKHILLLGASRGACGFDDELYSSVEVVAEGAEMAVYSYCKARKFLEANSHIDTIFLSFQYGSFTQQTDDVLFSETYLSKISHYLTLMQKDEYKLFYNKQRELLLKAILQSFIHNNYHCVAKYLQHNLTYRDMQIGRREKSDYSNLQKEIEMINQHGSDDYTISDPPLSEIQISYLNKINALCKERNVALVLISIPMYKPEIYDFPKEKLHSLYNNYFEEIPFADYSFLSFPDSCYRDIGHLNNNGARLFTEYLLQNLNKDIKINSLQINKL
jgi:hypothetical protein